MLKFRQKVYLVYLLSGVNNANGQVVKPKLGKSDRQQKKSISILNFGFAICLFKALFGLSTYICVLIGFK